MINLINRIIVNFLIMEIIDIIKNKSTRREKIFAFLLIIMFGVYKFSFFIFSILFHKPILYCELNGIY